MSDAIIKVNNVNKRFGKNKILEQVNLEITSGEIFGIIGLSGSGKTTLLNTLIGFLRPEVGDVLFKLEHLLNFRESDEQYRSVFKNQMDVKTIFGFAAQSASVYTQLDSVENLDYFGRLYGLSKDIRKTNIEILLKLMNLYESKNVLAGNLSGGMLKRLDIACSLIHDPKILLLDEPTSDLDPLLRKQMWDLIKEINQKGTTIILSSHFLDELEHLCDRVGILYDSTIVKTGTPNEIKSFYSKEQEITLETTPGKYEEILKKLGKAKDIGVTSTSISGNKLVIYTQNAQKNLHKILHIIEEMEEMLIDVTVEDPSLREVLQKITEDKNG